MKMDRAEALYRFYVQQSEQGIKDLKGWNIHCQQQQGLFNQEMDAAIQRIKDKAKSRPFFCIYAFSGVTIFSVREEFSCMHMVMSICWKKILSRKRFI